MELRVAYSIHEAWRTLLWLLAIDLGFFVAYVAIAGGVGLEIIGFLFLTPGSIGYKLEVACEELLEMSGVSVILYAVLLMNLNLSCARSPGPRGAPQRSRAQ